MSNGNNYLRVPKWISGLLLTILIALLSFFLVWGAYENKVQRNIRDINSLKMDVDKLKTMHTDIALIKNDVKWIKESLKVKNVKKGDSSK